MANTSLKALLRGIIPALAVLTILVGSASPVSAQRGRIVIKMASMAPQNTTWHDELMIMAQRWREESDGRVDLRVIPGATGGEEADVLVKMRIGQFQAGTFSLAGLQHLTTGVAALAIPFLAETQEDLHRIRDAVGPLIEEHFLEQGYVVLHWADLGWMRFFTPEPDTSPETVLGYRFVQWGDDSMSDIWADAGVEPGVRMNIADIALGLERGVVDAINTAPLVILAYQWFAQLKYMLDIRWAPLSGATLVDRETWESIPEDLRTRLKAIAEETGEKVQAQLIDWERDAIERMEEAGLQVVQPTPEHLAEWQALFDRLVPRLRGDKIPEAWYDEAMRVGTEGKGR
jgi:TRAP-type C4-dicarboxylate transport system substrate-binding protein